MPQPGESSGGMHTAAMRAVIGHPKKPCVAKAVKLECASSGTRCHRSYIDDRLQRSAKQQPLAARSLGTWYVCMPPTAASTCLQSSRFDLAWFVCCTGSVSCASANCSFSRDTGAPAPSADPRDARPPEEQSSALDKWRRSYSNGLCLLY